MRNIERYVYVTFMATIIITFFVILNNPCGAQEPKFYCPKNGDTLYTGDSVTLDINAPRYQAFSGKSWSLVLVINPYTATERMFPLVDTLKFPADTSLHLIQKIKVPSQRMGKETYVLALQFNPSRSLYYSGMFTLAPKPASIQKKSANISLVPYQDLRYDLIGRIYSKGK